jgi:hypothetical protein
MVTIVPHHREMYTPKVTICKVVCEWGHECINPQGNDDEFLTCNEVLDLYLLFWIERSELAAKDNF